MRIEEPLTTWGVLRDPVKAEWVVVARSSDDREFIRIHPFEDFAGNADAAQALADAMNRLVAKGHQIRRASSVSVLEREDR